MKSLLSILLILSVFASCTQSNRDSNSFDTNPAEAADSPGDRDRKNSETNEEAARRGGKTEPNDPGDENHPALTELGEGTPIKESFATKAADAGHAELSFANLAMKKTKDADILAFAEMMRKEHSATNEELKSLAAGKGIELPTECSTCESTFKTFSELGTEEFNQRYAAMMVSDHERVVKLFTNEAQSGTDPEMQSWAKEKLPALQHHLEMARDLQKKQNVSASRSRNSDDKGSDKVSSDDNKADKKAEKKAARKEKKKARKERATKG